MKSTAAVATAVAVEAEKKITDVANAIVDTATKIKDNVVDTAVAAGNKIKDAGVAVGNWASDTSEKVVDWSKRAAVAVTAKAIGAAHWIGNTIGTATATIKNNVGGTIHIGKEQAISKDYYFFITSETGVGYPACGLITPSGLSYP